MNELEKQVAAPILPQDLYKRLEKSAINQDAMKILAKNSFHKRKLSDNVFTQKKRSLQSLMNSNFHFQLSSRPHLIPPPLAFRPEKAI